MSKDLVMNEPVEVALALVQRGSCWLVNRRRSGTGPDPCWEFPGGKMEPGETPFEAAVRECREEVGLAVAPIELLGVVTHDYADGSVRLHLVVCRELRPSDVAEERLQASVRWVSLEGLARLTMLEANDAIIERLTRWCGVP